MAWATPVSVSGVLGTEHWKRVTVSRVLETGTVSGVLGAGLEREFLKREVQEGSMRPVYPSRRPQRQAHRRGGQGSRGAGGRGNVLDSNGPAGRLRGTAAQLQEKYRSLATDAQTHGDRVQAEAFLQYAEHYRRLLNDGGRESAREGRQSNGRANEERGEERREERSENAARRAK